MNHLKTWIQIKNTVLIGFLIQNQDKKMFMI
jgi:hypothetical protein